jgi:beta-lactamase class A
MIKHLFITAIVLLALPLSAKESLPELTAKMDKIAQDFGGVLGYSLHYRYKTDERIELRGDEIFPSASTIKTAIMCEAMHQVEQGKVKWDQQIPVQGEDYRQEGGFANDFKLGTSLPLDQWVHLMITVSDNTATMNLREFLGQKNVNDWLDAHGFKNTRLLNGKKCDELGLRPLQQKWGLGMTTPNDMVRLFELIVDGKAGSPASCDRMLRILTHQYWDDCILSQVPPNVHAAAKSGALDHCRSDVAVVDSPGGQYVLAIYTKEQKDTSWTHANEGDVAIRTLARMVWEHYNPDHPWKAPAGSENLLPGGK